MGALNKKSPLGKEDFLVSAERLELSTNGLKGHCSAIELRAQRTWILSRPHPPVNQRLWKFGLVLSFPSTFFLVFLFSHFSFLVFCFSLLISHFSFLLSRFSLLISHFSFLLSRFSLLTSHFSFLLSRFSSLVSHLPYVLHQSSLEALVYLMYTSCIPRTENERRMNGEGLALRYTYAILMCLSPNCQS
jgi:hypothetical protein